MMKANEPRTVRVAGREYRLRYTVNSLCALEDRAGMSIDRLMNRQFSATRLLLWAGLTQCQPELSVRDAGDLITAAMRRGDSLERIVELRSGAERFRGEDAPLQERIEDGVHVVRLAGHGMTPFHAVRIKEQRQAARAPVRLAMR